jgi:hypothetical protein
MLCIGDEDGSLLQGKTEDCRPLLQRNQNGKITRAHGPCMWGVLHASLSWLSLLLLASCFLFSVETTRKISDTGQLPYDGSAVLG